MSLMLRCHSITLQLGENIVDKFSDFFCNFIWQSIQAFKFSEVFFGSPIGCESDVINLYLPQTDHALSVVKECTY